MSKLGKIPFNDGILLDREYSIEEIPDVVSENAIYKILCTHKNHNFIRKALSNYKNYFKCIDLSTLKIRYLKILCLL